MLSHLEVRFQTFKGNLQDIHHSLSLGKPLHHSLQDIPVQEQLDYLLAIYILTCYPDFPKHLPKDLSYSQAANVEAPTPNLNGSEKAILNLLIEAKGGYVGLDEINGANKQKKFIKPRGGNYNIALGTVKSIIKALRDTGYFKIDTHPDGGMWRLPCKDL
jgi:hypothetical protein